jgi:hypothetical protein
MPTESRDESTADERRRRRALLIRELFEVAVDETLENEAFDNRVAGIAERLVSPGDGESDGLSLLFHERGIYVDGKLLKADRETYESFVGLESFLGKFRCNEIALESGYDGDDIEAVAEALQRMEQRPLAVTEPVEPTETSTIGYTQPAERAGLLEPLTGPRPLEVRIARYYAACLQTLRAYHGAEVSERQSMLDELKRISQVLVHLSGRSRPAMLALLGLREARDEFCSVVLDSAVLALLMARRLTGQLDTLRRISFAALTVDAAQREGGKEPRLSGQETVRSAAHTAASILQGSQTNDSSHRRAIEVHELHTLIQSGHDALSYDTGVPPKIESLLVKVARRYTYLGAKPPSVARRGTPDEIVQTLLRQAEDDSELMALHLLVDTLGLFTLGMPVALSSGWKGVVLAASDRITDYHLPTIRLACNPDGEWVESTDVDLKTVVDEDRYGYVARRLDDPDKSLQTLQRRVLEDESLTP